MNLIKKESYHEDFPIQSHDNSDDDSDGIHVLAQSYKNSNLGIQRKRALNKKKKRNLKTYSTPSVLGT